MKLLRPVIFVCMILFFIPRTVHAEEEAMALFYAEETPGEFTPDSVPISFGDGFGPDEKAFVVFDNLCKNQGGRKSFIPPGTMLISVTLKGDTVLLNFTKEIESGGGSMNRALFVKQIVDTAYSIDEIRSIMVYAEGVETALSEGVDFHIYDRELKTDG